MRTWWLWAVVVGAAGCENWYTWEDVTTPFVGPGTIGVRVTTTPEAWPHDLYGHAVHAAFYDVGPVTVIDGEDLDLLQVSDDAVHVLDAWRGCDRRTTCVRELFYDVGCFDGDRCEGEFRVDAFFSTHPVPEPDQGGSITLELITDDPEPGTGPVLAW